jgi:twitching motility protein PilI
MEYVQESLLVLGEQITPIPNMSTFVVGLMNSRDRVFCAIDLPQLLELLSPLKYSRQYHIVVININQFLDQPSTSEQELLLGLIVNKIEGITRVMSDEMFSAKGDVSSSFTPYLQGWVIHDELQLPVLDIPTIVKKTL